MSAYYYVLASLPYLQFEKPPRVSLEWFLSFVGTQVTKKDYKTLAQVTIRNFDNQAQINRLFRRFQEWEINLRNALVTLRAQARKVDGEKYLREIPPVVEAGRSARMAVEAPDPLAAEELLLRARFDYLSSLEVGHQFDIEALIIYRLKLEILEQKSRLRSDAGRAEYDRLSRELDTNMRNA